MATGVSVISSACVLLGPKLLPESSQTQRGKRIKILLNHPEVVPHAEITPKTLTNHTSHIEIIPKLFRSHLDHSNVIPEPSPNHSKVIPKTRYTDMCLGLERDSK